MTNLITYTICTIAFVLFEVFRDEFYIKENVKIDHYYNWSIRFLFFVPMGLEGIPMFFLFYTIFDPLLNLLRGKDFFYVNNNDDPNASKWDKLFKKSPVLFFFVEIILFITSFYLIFVL